MKKQRQQGGFLPCHLALIMDIYRNTFLCAAIIVALVTFSKGMSIWFFSVVLKYWMKYFVGRLYPISWPFILYDYTMKLQFLFILSFIFPLETWPGYRKGVNMYPRKNIFNSELLWRHCGVIKKKHDVKIQEIPHPWSLTYGFWCSDDPQHPPATKRPPQTICLVR